MYLTGATVKNISCSDFPHNSEAVMFSLGFAFHFKLNSNLFFFPRKVR